MLAKLVVSQAADRRYNLEDCRGTLDDARMTLARAVVAAAGTAFLDDAAKTLRARHPALIA